MSLNKEFPWLDQNGKPLSDQQLKKVSQEWNAKTWERYLKSLEGYRIESQITNESHFDERAEEIQISTLFQEHDEESEYNRLKKLLTDAINSLNENQKTIILGLFYFNTSQRQLAKELNISHVAVAKTRDRAIERLKVFLEKPTSIKRDNGNPVVTVTTGVTTLPLSEGIKNLIQKLGGKSHERKRTTTETTEGHR